MHCSTVDLDDFVAPSGAVVVIDVLRACTTAAAALAAGATEVVVTGTVGEAFALRDRLGGAPIAGEVDGFPVPGFDFTNSPVALGAAADLGGRPLVLRTTAGTQGLLAARDAGLVLAGAFVTASATAALLRAASPRTVTFLVSGSHSADRGEEDRALADYLAASLEGLSPDAEPYVDRARRSAAGRRFTSEGDLAAFAGDLEACLALDRYDFAVRLGGGGVARLVRARPGG